MTLNLGKLKGNGIILIVPFLILCVLHISRLLCKEVNHDNSFNLEERGPVEMKGRTEPMRCWFLSRATDKTFNSRSPHTNPSVVETDV